MFATLFWSIPSLIRPNLLTLELCIGFFNDGDLVGQIGLPERSARNRHLHFDVFHMALMYLSIWALTHFLFDFAKLMSVSEKTYLPHSYNEKKLVFCRLLFHQKKYVCVAIDSIRQMPMVYYQGVLSTTSLGTNHALSTWSLLQEASCQFCSK